MDSVTLFLLPDGRPRAGWRLLIFATGWVLLFLPASLLSRVAAESGYGAVAEAALLLITLLTTWLVLKIFDRQPFGAVGLQRSAGWWRNSLYGVGAAACGVAGVAGVLAAGAGVRWESVAYSPAGLLDNGGQMASAVAFLLTAAAFEELFFRGYLFQRLVEGLGALAAVVISALVFGFVHWNNPAASLISTANTVLAGVVLALAYFKSASLWYSIGWHFGWNWVLAAVGFQVSGLELMRLSWKTSFPESGSWLHGGAYGPEGGAVCTVLLVAMCLALWRHPNWVGCIRLEAAQPGALDTPPGPAPNQTGFISVGDS